VIEEATKTLEGEFEAREFIQPQEMFQIFGVRLFLTDIGLLQKSMDEIVEECKSYIDDLRTDGKLPNKLKEATRIDSFRSFGGFAQVSGETKEFKKILEYYDQTLDDIVEASVPSMVSELIELMKTDQLQFGRQVSRTAYGPAPYADFPILRRLKPEEFVKIVLELKPKGQSRVLAAMKIRYEYQGVGHELATELPWLKDVYQLLDRKAATLRPTSRFRIRAGLKNYIQPLIVGLPPGAK
jgi:ribosomal protein S10